MSVALVALLILGLGYLACALLIECVTRPRSDRVAGPSGADYDRTW